MECKHGEPATLNAANGLPRCAACRYQVMMKLPMAQRPGVKPVFDWTLLAANPKTPICPHDLDLLLVTKEGWPRCPICRRVAQGRTIRPPSVDYAARAANNYIQGEL